MKVTKINKNMKCDINGCSNKAEYTFEFKKAFKGYGLNLCKHCINDLYMSIGEHIVPKSPINMLNFEKRKEKKLESKKQ